MTTSNRVKEIRFCKRCNEPFHRKNGNVGAKYCSRLCSLRDLNTLEHQAKAGKVGGAIKKSRRGIFTKTTSYIKEEGVHQHRIVMEKKLGRKLNRGEIVHHKDGNKHNNDPENLQVMTQSEHIKLHLHNATAL